MSIYRFLCIFHFAHCLGFTKLKATESYALKQWALFLCPVHLNLIYEYMVITMTIYSMHHI